MHPEQEIVYRPIVYDHVQHLITVTNWPTFTNAAKIPEAFHAIDNLSDLSK